MYRKVRPVTHEAVVHTPAGDALALGGGGDGGDGGGGGGATSEVATFGVFLSSRGGGEELRNEAAGVGARTRPAPTRRTRTLLLGHRWHLPTCCRDNTPTVRLAVSPATDVAAGPVYLS